MTIELPEGLPALDVLQAEGHTSACRRTAARWQPRPIEIAVLNLMPNKAATEVQLARLLASTPFDVRVTLLVPDGHIAHTTPAEHLARFYRPWSTVRHRRFDGLIITGAPVETIPCEQVDYWRELTGILDWTKEHVARTCYICWGAMAALYHFHGVRTPVLPQKRFGVYVQTVRDPGSAWLRGFGDSFPVPVSRRAELSAATLPKIDGLSVLADSPDSGICLMAEARRGAIYMFNHLEYDATTLRDEYFRDLGAGRAIALPVSYFPGDDPGRPPTHTWRPFAQLLFTNWVADICDAVLPSVDSARCLDWLLAEPAATEGAGSFADFLLVADETPAFCRSSCSALRAPATGPLPRGFIGVPAGRRSSSCGSRSFRPTVRSGSCGTCFAFRTSERSSCDRDEAAKEAPTGALPPIPATSARDPGLTASSRPTPAWFTRLPPRQGARAQSDASALWPCRRGVATLA